MNIFFLQTNATDTITQVVKDSLSAAKPPINGEISVLEFAIKGGIFLVPIVILFFYTIYLIVERYSYISKTTKNDPYLIKEVRTHLNNGNMDLAIGAAEKVNNATARVVKEGILTIGRPIAEIESNMERAAQIELGEMEQKMGHLGLIAGMAPTLGFVGTIAGVIKIFYSISITENISIGNISGGLYEKMISSGAGLIVGLFAYAGYHLLNGKIDHYMLNVQKQVLEFVNIIQRPNGN
jgi:biopolymer transport protein ExbB